MAGLKHNIYPAHWPQNDRKSLLFFLLHQLRPHSSANGRHLHIAFVGRFDVESSRCLVTSDGCSKNQQYLKRKQVIIRRNNVCCPFFLEFPQKGYFVLRLFKGVGERLTIIVIRINGPNSNSGSTCLCSCIIVPWET